MEERSRSNSEDDDELREMVERALKESIKGKKSF